MPHSPWLSTGDLEFLISRPYSMATCEGVTAACHLSERYPGSVLTPRRSPHRYSEPAQLRAPRGAGEETGSSPGHACLLTEAHGNCSPRASSYSPRTMHLGAEQQPPTAPATEAAHPAFPASRAVFRCCLQTPASGGGSKPCAGRAPRTRGEQPRREPPGTSVDQRRVSNSSLLLSRLVSAVHPIRTAES
ncbi:hypothetical protein NDU88_000896 [Pleurodeles waltl]|uniref:Uncharacterized protein n=1 Tax=Pleurodeles waltl TaxID=8319 RepID=A0AAV7LYV6_PLEWA|nr:hypothetical protein NDU88_000896 [Pleurodeles waltl]